MLGKIGRTTVGALRNRGELLAIEWQEERERLTELLVWTVAWLFFGVMGMILLTGTIIFLFPEDKRLYVAGGFTALYFLGALALWFVVKKLLNRQAFTESLDQMKKDTEWVDSLK